MACLQLFVFGARNVNVFTTGTEIKAMQSQMIKKSIKPLSASISPLSILFGADHTAAQTCLALGVSDVDHTHQ